MKTRVFLICLAFLLQPAAAGGDGQSAANPAPNVILLIGDGMGAGVLGLAKDYAAVIDGRELWIEKVISGGRLALVHAPSSDSLVTDSSAAATALATGEATLNGRISVSPRGDRLTTILELARKSSRSTGLVTTTSLSHATPACFAAHVGDRDSESRIAEQMLEAGVDLMMGGGLVQWIPKGATASDYARFTPSAETATISEREDNTNLLAGAARAGYEIVTNRDELLAAKKNGKLLGLFAASHLPYAIDRRPDDAADVPSLAEMTETAIKMLSGNGNGFFLMVEGGRIDHAAHTNDVGAIVAEMLDFDEAVGVAYAFANSSPGTTLFITADHATGGPCLSARYSDRAGETEYPDGDTLRKMSRQDASFEFILRSLASKPSIEKLRELILNHTGVNISKEDAAFIMKAGPVSPFHVIEPKYREFGYPMHAMGRILGTEYETAWATAEHHSEPLLLIGYGAKPDLVHGYVENTEVFKMMKAAGNL